VNDAEIRELAREILRREEFARWREEPGAVYDWLLWLSETLRALGGWILDHSPSWLADFFSWLKPSGETGALDPFGAIVGVASLLLVAFVAVALLRAFASQGGAARRESGALQQTSPGEDLRARADALARAGHFLEAAHAVQLAALQLLLERRWLVLDRFEPNRTLRERLLKSALPERERAQFMLLLGQLEARWFGDRGEGRTLFEGWCGLHEKLVALGEAK